MYYKQWDAEVGDLLFIFILNKYYMLSFMFTGLVLCLNYNIPL